MEAKIDLSKYYDMGPMASYHTYFNMILGHRGVGKTYRFKKWCIKDYIENKKQFVWIRRYRQETKKIKEFFKDLDKNNEFPGHTFSVKGGDKDGVFIVDGEVAGYYLTLSLASTYKSTPFPYVDKIIFDEFLIVGSSYHYLTNEVVILLELINTVFRDNDNVRGVYLLGNNVTMSNPYFLFFEITPFKGRFYIDRGRSLLCENYKNQAYIDNIKETRFGKLIQGTQYYDYAIENESLNDTDTFIEERSINSRFKFSVKYMGETIGFWSDINKGIMYASRDIDPTNKCKYCLTREDHEPNLYLIKNINNTFMHDIVFMFDNGNLRFEDAQIKNICYDILAFFRK